MSLFLMTEAATDYWLRGERPFSRWYFNEYGELRDARWSHFDGQEWTKRGDGEVGPLARWADDGGRCA